MEFTPVERAAAAALARVDFYFFTKWMYLQRTGNRWVDAPHFKVVADALTALYWGIYQFLLINIPPRYGKTELVKNFVAWTLGRHPDSEYIYTSYAAERASDSSVETREIVTHPAYAEIFPGISLNFDRNRQDSWRTTADGAIYAAPAGGALTGFGAGKKREGFGGLIAVDDPLKPEDARHDNKREEVNNWFPRTLWSRRNSAHTPVVVIMQRLHEMDPSGFLLAGGMGIEFKHVCLEALRPDGTALWPAMHTSEALRAMEQARPYDFAGQYQQRPAPVTGGFFKPDAMPIIDAIPVGTRFVRGWDLAATVDDGAYTSGGLIGKMPDGRYLIADIARLRGSADQVEATLKNTAARDGKSVAVHLPQDPGQAGKSQILYLTRQLAGFTVKSSPESGDKVTRAEPLASQINVGNVCMLRGEWNSALVGEMRFFPNGKYKDQIDCLSRGFNALTSAPAPATCEPLFL